MVRDPSETAVAAWIALMRAQQKTLLCIERALRARGLPSLACYDALWELDRAGVAGLRPFEIERQMLLAQSNISRLIDRLQEQGYVKRQPCEVDGRGQYITITAAGRELRRRMWPVYARAIHESIDLRVSPREATTLAALLTKLVDEQK
jgi:DNA-binding MarR family transcriptional regulator